MIDLDEFMPQIAPKAPACPVPSAHVAILQTASDLCARTKLWRHSDQCYVNDLDDIQFTPPDGSVVVDFESVLFNDAELEPKTAKWMDQCMRGWRHGDIPGYPKYFSQTNFGNLRIAPIEIGMVTINAFIKPAMNAEQLPDFLFQQYGELIAWGALGRILSTPDQPFTSFEAGSAYLQAYEQKLQSLMFKSTTGQQRARMRTRAYYV